MDSKQELDQIEDEASLLKATLVRYLKEVSFQESQRTDELRAQIQAASNAIARPIENKLNSLCNSVESLRGDLKNLMSQDKTMQHVRAVLREELARLNNQRLADKPNDASSRQLLDEIQELVREIKCMVQRMDALPKPAMEHGHSDDAPNETRRRPLVPERYEPPAVGKWRRFWNTWTDRQTEYAVLGGVAVMCLAIVGITWQGSATSKPSPSAATREILDPGLRLPMPQSSSPGAPVASDDFPAAVPTPSQNNAWNESWPKALAMNVSRCHDKPVDPEKAATTLRQCLCPAKDNGEFCEIDERWAHADLVAAVQGVLNTKRPTQIGLDGRKGTQTTVGLTDLATRCSFGPQFSQLILRFNSSATESAGRGEPDAALELLRFLAANFHQCGGA